jgi:putative DNA primase/helicase
MKIVNSSRMLICASELEPEPTYWLWPEWLVLGKITLLAGGDETHKKAMACKVAATVTNGDRWPNGQGCAAANVLIVSNELDFYASHLRAIGADSAHLYGFEHRLTARTRNTDFSALLLNLDQHYLKIGNVRLILIDPLIHFLGGGSALGVQRNLQRFAHLVDQTQAAVLGLCSFEPVAKKYHPLECIPKGIALRGWVDTVWVTAQARDMPQSSALLKIKAKQAPVRCGYSYHLKSRKAAHIDAVSPVHWGESLTPLELAGFYRSL